MFGGSSDKENKNEKKEKKKQQREKRKQERQRKSQERAVSFLLEACNVDEKMLKGDPEDKQNENQEQLEVGLGTKALRVVKGAAGIASGAAEMSWALRKNRERMGKKVVRSSEKGIAKFATTVLQGFGNGLSRIVNGNFGRETGIKGASLHRAIVNKDFEKIKELVDEGVDVNKPINEMQDTLLTWAVSCMNVDLVDFLLERDAKVNVKNKIGRTPISLATVWATAKDDAVTILEALLKKDPSGVDERNKNKETPLSLAIKNNTPEVVRLLLENGADFRKKSNGSAPVSEALEKYNSNPEDPLAKKMLESFISAGANLEKQEDGSYKNLDDEDDYEDFDEEKQGQNNMDYTLKGPLMIQGYNNLKAKFLDSKLGKAYSNAKDKVRNSQLGKAWSKFKTDVQDGMTDLFTGKRNEAPIIIEKSDSEEAVKRNDFRSFIWQKNFESAEQLINEGVNVDTVIDKFKNTALFYAINSLNLDFARFLVSRGANVNVVNSQGMTPLIKCASCSGFDAKKSKGLSKVLLENNSESINFKTKDGHTALSLATKYKAKTLISLLKKYGAEEVKNNKVVFKEMSKWVGKYLTFTEGLNVVPEEGDNPDRKPLKAGTYKLLACWEKLGEQYIRVEGQQDKNTNKDEENIQKNNNFKLLLRKAIEYIEYPQKLNKQYLESNQEESQESNDDNSTTTSELSSDLPWTFRKYISFRKSEQERFNRKLNYSERLKKMNQKEINKNLLIEKGGFQLSDAAKKRNEFRKLIAQYNFKDAESLILDGVGVDTTIDRFRNTALFYAISVQDEDSVKSLISKGANLNVVNTMRLTPLMQCVKSARMDEKKAEKIAKAILLQDTSSVGFTSNEGLTAFEMAEQNGLEEIKVLLRSFSPEGVIEKNEELEKMSKWVGKDLTFKDGLRKLPEKNSNPYYEAIPAGVYKLLGCWEQAGELFIRVKSEFDIYTFDNGKKEKDETSTFKLLLNDAVNYIESNKESMEKAEEKTTAEENEKSNENEYEKNISEITINSIDSDAVPKDNVLGGDNLYIEKNWGKSEEEKQMVEKRNKFRECVSKFDFQEAEKLLAEGIDINTTVDRFSNNALFFSIKALDTDATKKFIDMGINTNKINAQKITPLMNCVIASKTNVKKAEEMIKAILEKDSSSIGLKNNDGLTALDLAEKYKKDSIKTLLTEFSPEYINSRFEKMSAWVGKTLLLRGGLRIIPEKSGNPYYKVIPEGIYKLLGCWEQSGNQYIRVKSEFDIYTYKDGKKEKDENSTFKLLLKNAVKHILAPRSLVDIDENEKESTQDFTESQILSPEKEKQSENKEQSLMRSIFKEDIENVRSLIKDGADVNYIDPNGQTPLLLVTRCRNEFKALAKLLLDKDKSKVNYTDNYGNTALSNVIYNFSHHDTFDVNLLLKNGADANVKVNDKPVLTFMIEDSKIQWGNYLFKVLVENGARVDELDQQGRTPLMFAISEGKYNIAKVLMENDNRDDHYKSDLGDELKQLISFKKQIAQKLKLKEEPSIVRNALRSIENVLPRKTQGDNNIKDIYKKTLFSQASRNINALIELEDILAQKMQGDNLNTESEPESSMNLKSLEEMKKFDPVWEVYRALDHGYGDTSRILSYIDSFPEDFDKIESPTSLLLMAIECKMGSIAEALINKGADFRKEEKGKLNFKVFLETFKDNESIIKYWIKYKPRYFNLKSVELSDLEKVFDKESAENLYYASPGLPSFSYEYVREKNEQKLQKKLHQYEEMKKQREEQYKKSEIETARLQSVFKSFPTPEELGIDMPNKLGSPTISLPNLEELKEDQNSDFMNSLQFSDEDIANYQDITDQSSEKLDLPDINFDGNADFVNFNDVKDIKPDNITTDGIDPFNVPSNLKSNYNNEKDDTYKKVKNIDQDKIQGDKLSSKSEVSKSTNYSDENPESMSLDKGDLKSKERIKYSIRNSPKAKDKTEIIEDLVDLTIDLAKSKRLHVGKGGFKKSCLKGISQIGRFLGGLVGELIDQIF